MKIVFFSTPVYSHINSFFPVVTLLTNRGDDVYFITGKKYRGFANLTKSIFVGYPDEFSDVSFSREAVNLFFIYEKMLKHYEKLIEFSLDLLSVVRPDYIIHDSLAGFAKTAARQSGIPAINVITTLAVSPLVVLFNPAICLWGIKSFLSAPAVACDIFSLCGNLERKYILKKSPLVDLFINRENLNIVMTPKKIQPFGGTFGHSFFFARPTIDERMQKRISANIDNEEADKNKRPLIYVSLGSTISSDKVVKGLTDVLIHKNADVIFSGADNENKFKNIAYFHFVNQLEILQKADLFINHGGLNSIYEAIWFKAPQICIPLCPEMAVNAKLVKKSKCGFVLKKFNKKLLSKMIDNILGKKGGFSFEIAGEFYKAQDIDKLVTRIDNYIGTYYG